MKQGITLEQKQELRLTPQMRLSLKVLQMDVIELNHWLEKELQDNPVLELDINQIVEKEKDLINNMDFDNKKDREHDKYFKEFSSYYFNRKELPREKEIPSYDGRNAPGSINLNRTLHEHLLSYFKIAVNNDLDYKIGEYIIGNINQNGYLITSCQEISKDLKIPEKRIKKILAIIQNSSIPGLGARNLKECLLLQLKYFKNENKDIIKKLITCYLDELSQKNFNTICKELHLSNYDIQCLLDMIIKNFDPKPGRIFSQNSEIKFLIPDIIIKKIDEKYEIYEIIENNNYIPSIRINPLYNNILLEKKERVNNKGKKAAVNNKEIEHKNTLKYLEEKINSANWIIRCVEQRRKTVLDITRYIIDYQRDFLEKGITSLKPLSMKEVAKDLGIHESTVSRATNNKKIQLPKGFYDIKYFFSKGLPQEKKETISNEKVKRIIKDYIKTENPYYPYSDQKITELLLKKENIQIARRTVAKYRKLQGILPARIRRRYKKH